VNKNETSGMFCTLLQDQLGPFYRARSGPFYRARSVPFYRALHRALPFYNAFHIMAHVNGIGFVPCRIAHNVCVSPLNKKFCSFVNTHGANLKVFYLHDIMSVLFCNSKHCHILHGMSKSDSQNLCMCIINIYLP
jgi:hypothetical protein